jgi:hypothetical protein
MFAGVRFISFEAYPLSLHSKFGMSWMAGVRFLDDVCLRHDVGPMLFIPRLLHS